MGEGEDVAMTGHLALGLWVNGLRCLAKGGLSLPEVLAQGEHSFAWMLDSGYLTTDGRLLAKPGTPLQEGDLLFLRRSLLLSLLRNRVSSPILHRDQILSLEDEDEGGREGGRVRVTLQSGKEEVVDIVVGADGMFSPLVRETTMGLPPPAQRGYTVFRGVYEGSPLQPGFSFQTWGPSSRFSSVPLADGQVWFATLAHHNSSSSSSTGGGSRSMEGGREALKEGLLQRFGSWHAPCLEKKHLPARIPPHQHQQFISVHRPAPTWAHIISA
ncbi:fad-dependent oxidoreductase [Nannochloropsis oceanica]